MRWLVPGVWFALLVLHVHLLVTAEGAADRGLGSQLALLGSSVFFGLQLLFPRLLRPRCPRRGLILFVLLAALVHQDVRTSAWEEFGQWKLLEVGTAALAIAAFVAAVRLRPRSGLPPEVTAPLRVFRTAVDRLVATRAGPRRLPLLPRPPPHAFLTPRV